LYAYFRELEELHEIISPDKFLRPFLKDYGTLADMVQMVRAAYGRGISYDKSFLRKTEQFVKEHTATYGIQTPTKTVMLTPDALAAIADQDAPDTVKVFNLLKAIDQLTGQAACREPYLLSIGDKAQQIAERFEERQDTTQATLEELRKLIEEVRQARQERDASQRSPEAFAVYWLLKKDGVAGADEVAKAAEVAFAEHPHWQTSSQQEREVRKSLFKALIDAGVEAVVEVGESVLKMLRRAIS
jgi:type I restriction enzyme R subunit